MSLKWSATLCAAMAAMFSMNAGSASAQGLFGGYAQGYPVYQQSCPTGNCPLRSNTTYYGASPCASGNCPTSGYVTGYPSANCPNGNCASGQCRTICGPNGCQTICPNGASPCGPNGCPPSVGYGNVNYGTTALPSLNLDQTPAWNGGGNSYVAPTFNPNAGFNAAPNFEPVAPQRSFNRYQGGNYPMNGGFVPTGMNTNITNDPMVHLN